MGGKGSIMERTYNVVGYVKLAKKWERTEESARLYHRDYYQNKFLSFPTYKLHNVYIDITGKKEIYNRPAMVRLLRDCKEGLVDVIFTQTKGYLAANTAEFCYLLYFLFTMDHRIDIVTEDDAYNINTLVDADGQREALLKMAEDCIYLNPPDFHEWLSELSKSINRIDQE